LECALSRPSATARPPCLVGIGASPPDTAASSQTQDTPNFGPSNLTHAGSDAHCLPCALLRPLRARQGTENGGRDVSTTHGSLRRARSHGAHGAHRAHSISLHASAVYRAQESSLARASDAPTLHSSTSYRAQAMLLGFPPLSCGIACACGRSRAEPGSRGTTCDLRLACTLERRARAMVYASFCRASRRLRAFVEARGGEAHGGRGSRCIAPPRVGYRGHAVYRHPGTAPEVRPFSPFSSLSLHWSRRR
jgi:hypothetical protein